MPSPSPLFRHQKIVWWAVQIIKLLVMYSSPLPCYLVPLGPKYSPQPPIHKFPQITFLPQCERPSFTPINGQKEETKQKCSRFHTHAVSGGDVPMCIAWNGVNFLLSVCCLVAGIAAVLVAMKWQLQKRPCAVTSCGRALCCSQLADCHWVARSAFEEMSR